MTTFSPNRRLRRSAGEFAAGMIFPFGEPVLAVYVTRVHHDSGRVRIHGTFNPKDLIDEINQIVIDIHEASLMTRYDAPDWRSEVSQ